MNDILSTLTTTRPLSHQLIRWCLAALLFTIVLEGAIIALHLWIINLSLSWGQAIELFGFFFCLNLTLVARQRAKASGLTRQFLNLMAQSLTRAPDETTQKQLQTLHTINNVHLGFELLVYRLANGLCKLFFFIFLGHCALRWLF